MKLVWLGVIVPGAVILFIAIVASLNIGFEETVVVPESISIDSLKSEECTLYGQVSNEEKPLVMRRTLTNNFFLTLNMEVVSRKRFCYTYDDSVKSYDYEYLSVANNYKKLLGNGSEEIFDNPYFYYKNREIAPGETIIEETRIQPICIPKKKPSSEEGVAVVPIKSTRPDPNGILIIESEKGKYSNCQSLTQSQKDSAIKIPIQ